MFLVVFPQLSTDTCLLSSILIQVSEGNQKVQHVWTAAINDCTHHSKIMTADSSPATNHSEIHCSNLSVVSRANLKRTTHPVPNIFQLNYHMLYVDYMTYITYFTAFIHTALPFLSITMHHVLKCYLSKSNGMQKSKLLILQ